jgi:hypothetical protein
MIEVVVVVPNVKIVQLLLGRGRRLRFDLQLEFMS